MTARYVPIPADTGDGRTVEVRLVPWDAPARVTDNGRDWYSETFARGGLRLGGGRLLVRSEHDGAVIGRIDSADNRADGLYAQLRIADTSAGRDTLALIADGVLDAVSVEFDDPAPIVAGHSVIRTGAVCSGVALTLHPQHAAPVVAVRSTVQEEPMPRPRSDEPPDDEPEPEPEPDEPDTGPPDDSPVRPLQRSAPAPRAAARLAAVPATPMYRSFGEFIRENAHGRVAPEIRGRYERALANEVTGDIPGLIRDAWVPTIAGMIDRGQAFVNAFTTMPLGDGDPVAYPTVTQMPTVGTQTTQKSEVPSGKMLIAKQTASVETFAGGQDISLQAIRFSTPSYLDILFRAFAMQMAAYTDIQAILVADAVAIGAGGNGNQDLPLSPVTWTQVLANAAGLIVTNTGQAPDVLVASVGFWAKLIGIADSSGRPLFPAGINGPMNAIGQAELDRLSAQVLGLNVYVDPNLAGDIAYMGWSGAFVSFLDPVRIISALEPSLLGEEYAVYRFGAFAVVWPKGVVKLTMTGV